MGKLQDKVIVVTGASRGLGEAMAIGFAGEGARIVLAGRTGSDLNKVAAACKEAGGPDIATIPTDVSDEAQVQNLVDRTLERFGGIDVFVNNAGIGPSAVSNKEYGELTTYDLPVVEALLRTNVIGVWLCMRAALPVMKEGGSLINIGSGTGRIAYARAGMYAVSKSAVDTLTKISSKEMAPKGIRVNCLSPGGMTDTHLFGPNKLPEHLKARGFLTADVIVPAAIWLASDESADINGAFISGKQFNSKSVDEVRADIAAGVMPG